MSTDRQVDKEAVVHTHSGLLPGRKKESRHLQQHDRPRRYYARWNKSDRRRHIPRDFTGMWNLRNNIKEQTRQKQDSENKLMISRWEGVGWKRGRDYDVQITWNKNSHGNVKYNIGTIVSNIVITMYGARWVLDLVGDHIVSYANI